MRLAINQLRIYGDMNERIYAELRIYGDMSGANLRRIAHLRRYERVNLRRIAQLSLMAFLFLFHQLSFAQSIELDNEMKLKHQIILKTYLKICSWTQSGCNYINKRLGIYVVGSDGSAVFWNENSALNFEYGYFSSGEYTWQDVNGVWHTSSWRHVGGYALPYGGGGGGSVWSSKYLVQTGTCSVNFTHNGVTHLPAGNVFPERLNTCFSIAKQYGWFCFYGFGQFSQDCNSQQNLTCTCHNHAPAIAFNDGWTTLPISSEIINNNSEIVAQFHEAKNNIITKIPNDNDFSVIEDDFNNSVEWLQNGVSTNVPVGSTETFSNPFSSSTTSGSTNNFFYLNLSSMTERWDEQFRSSTTIDISPYEIQVSSAWNKLSSIASAIPNRFRALFPSRPEWDGCFSFDFSSSFSGGQNTTFCLSELPDWPYLLGLIRMAITLSAFIVGYIFFLSGE